MNDHPIYPGGCKANVSCLVFLKHGIDSFSFFYEARVVAEHQIWQLLFLFYSTKFLFACKILYMSFTYLFEISYVSGQISQKSFFSFFFFISLAVPSV